MASKAHKDRDNVAESLRRHGFGPEGIAAVFAMEEKLATKPKPAAVVETVLDFGDWA